MLSEIVYISDTSNEPVQNRTKVLHKYIDWLIGVLTARQHRYK